MIKSYRDLRVWQKAIDLTEVIYKVSGAFPREEIYGLTSQIRRAAVSISSNIAEGSSRRSTKEYIRFVNVSSGSLAELETQLIVAHRLSLLETKALEELLMLTDEISKMLFALQRSLGEKIAA